MGELGETQTYTDLEIPNAWSQIPFCCENMEQMGFEVRPL